MLWSKKAPKSTSSTDPQIEMQTRSDQIRLPSADGDHQNPTDVDEPKPDEEGARRHPNENGAQYPPFKVVLPIVLSICSAVFLTALDRTIIGVAIPAISNEFHSFDDISWYESAYLLTLSIFQLPMGKIYTFFPSKYTFLTIVLTFEVGSIICAAAPTSTALIIGRAIAGIGSAGTITGAYVIFADLLPLEKRPKYQGFLGATFGLASILGPVLGGVFTSKVTWRWCFWINAPVGGAALVGLVLLLPVKPPPKQNDGKTWSQRIWQFDPIGQALMVPGLIMLLLALQWGGTQYSWSDARVVALLVVGAVLIIAFGVSQIWAGDNGTVPPRLIRQRTIAAGTVVVLAFGSTLVILSFYLPIWFQAIKQIPAIDAGVRLLPYFLITVVFVIGSGIGVSKTGYFAPWLTAGTMLQIIGCGLLTILRVDTTTGEWVGFEILVGAGIGLSLAQPNIAVQTVLSREDIPVGITILGFAQFFGGTVFITVCQSILSSTLKSKLAGSIPNLNPAALSSTGATDLTSLVTKDQLSLLLTAYNTAINNVFYVALAMSCVSFVASLFVEWRTVKKQPGAGGKENATPEAV